MVAFIFREAASRPHDPSLDTKKAEIILAKQRQGPSEAIQAYFDPELTRFADPDTSGEEPWKDDQTALA